MRTVPRPRRRYQLTTDRAAWGWRHQQDRARWKSIVDGGGVVCGVCHRYILPGTPWHLDHVVPQSLGGREGLKHPAHAACNISKGGANRKKFSASRRNRIF
jgi:hypothetical protein